MSNTGIYGDDCEDGSDHESSYAESPVDGYFEQRDHPQETFVENSSVQAEADSKARDAAESQASTSAQSQTSPQKLSTSPARSNTWADETSPLLDAGPAPPDYAAATAGRLRPYRPGVETQTSPEPRQGSNRRDPFTSNRFLFGANGSLFNSSRQPETMRDRGGSDASGDTPDEEHGLLWPTRRRQQHKRVWRLAGGCCKPTAILYVLSGVIVIGLIVLLARATRGASRASNGDQEGSGKRNSTSPSAPNPPSTPDAPGAPSPRPAHPDDGACNLPFYSDDTSWDFSNQHNINITEFLDESYMQGGITGNVWISQGPADQEQNIRISLSYTTSQPWSFADMGYSFREDYFEVRFNKNRKSHKGYGHADCMDVAVNIYVRDVAELKNLQINTAHLNVRSKGLLGVRNSWSKTEGSLVNSTVVNAMSGNVELEYWDSRKTIIETTSGAIHGTYALRDLLSVSTHSGSTGIHIDPKEADEKHAKPAEFTLTSHSGSVWVNYMEEDIPDRVYKSRIETHSGSVSGTYILGSSAAFHTQSGSVTADLIYYQSESAKSSSEESNLYTESGSASTSLHVLSRLLPSNSTIGNLHSSHKTGSGTLNLVYPQEWEGTVEGRSYSGTIVLKGRDLKTDLNGELGPVGKHVVARKGSGKSRLDFRTYSGSVMLAVETTSATRPFAIGPGRIVLCEDSWCWQYT